MLAPWTDAVPLDRSATSSAAVGPFGDVVRAPGSGLHLAGRPGVGARALLRAVVGVRGPRRASTVATQGQIERGGWVFARVDDRTGSTSTSSSGTCGSCWRPGSPSGSSWPPATRYEIRANWKLIHENYQECYHCSEIHPELCRVTPPDSGYSIEIAGLFVAGPMDLYPDVETMSLDGRSDGVPLRGLDEQPAPRGRLLRDLPEPADQPAPRLRPHASRRAAGARPDLRRVRVAVPAGGVRPRRVLDPAYAVDFWDVTNREDWAACESLQRAAASRGYRPGPLSEVWEAGVYMQTRMIAHGLPWTAP